ncbi:MAG: hypothetical protein ACRDS0_30520 [Pseudonocardiaceae bacterium]
MDHIPGRQITGEPRRAGAVLPAAIHRAARGPRRDSPQRGLPCVRFPVSSAELVRDRVRAELPTSLALQVPAPRFPAKTPAGRRVGSA